MSINRRSFIQTAAAVTASLSAPMVMANGGKPRVVVVGGGALAAFTEASPIFFLNSSVIIGEGLSSKTFWCLL